MKRILALDLGSVWVGTALSDPLKITCKPLKTIKLIELDNFLKETFALYQIETVVVGLPVTISGNESEQTKQIKEMTERLSLAYPQYQWHLEDERMSSAWAVDHQRDVQKKKRSKETKLQEHSLAAAFILQNYLSALFN